MILLNYETDEDKHATFNRPRVHRPIAMFQVDTHTWSGSRYTFPQILVATDNTRGEGNLGNTNKLWLLIPSPLQPFYRPWWGTRRVAGSVRLHSF